MKFICTDFWSSINKKQIDNLRTNHQGVYVLQDRQRIGYNIPQAVLQSKAPEDGQNCCLKHVELNWIYQ